MIFNNPIPQDLGYVDRGDPEKQFDLEINFEVTSADLGQIVDRCIKRHGVSATAIMLDEIKSIGFKYATKSAISISMTDIVVPPEKKDMVKAAEKKVEEITRMFHRGMLTEEERYKSVLSIWDETTKDVTTALQQSLEKYNPIRMMSDSGARGSIKQMRQLGGMRGLMYSATGRTMEIPIKSNFREGLNILEYFIAARGARKSLSDTALKTADSGYLTRRLVDVARTSLSANRTAEPATVFGFPPSQTVPR